MDDAAEAYQDLCNAQAHLNELLDTEDAAPDDIADARLACTQARTRYRWLIGVDDMEEETA